MICDIIILLCSLAIGLSIGCLFTLWTISNKYYGGRLIYKEDEDGLYTFMDRSMELDELLKKDYILLKVSQD